MVAMHDAFSARTTHYLVPGNDAIYGHGAINAVDSSGPDFVWTGWLLLLRFPHFLFANEGNRAPEVFISYRDFRGKTIERGQVSLFENCGTVFAKSSIFS